MKSSFLCMIVPFLLFVSFPFAGDAEESAVEDSLSLALKHFSFAVQYKKNGDFDESLLQYGKSIAFCDTLYQIHYSFAELLMLMDRKEQAKAEYLRTLTLNPSHHPSATLLAGMYYAEARYDSALSMYETMYRLEPEPSVLAGIARLREYLGKDAAAFEAARTLVDQGNETPENIHLAANLALKSGNLEAAERFSSLALAKNPNDRDMLRLGSAAALALNDTILAAGYLRRLSVVDSTDTSILVDLEILCRKTGDREGLIQALDRHLRLAPADTNVIEELAELMIAAGELTRGEALVQSGLGITSGDGRLHILMGEIQRIRGCNDKALSEYERALDDPAWAEAARTLIDRLPRPQEDPQKKEKEFFERGKNGNQ